VHFSIVYHVKVSRGAIEQSKEKRDNYEATVGDLYHDWQLVFVDESHCDRRTTQRRGGWAPIGDRARRRDFFIRGIKYVAPPYTLSSLPIISRYSVLPAISVDGVLHLDVITHSWTAEEFEQYIETLLDNMNPYPQRNSVIVMDNASTHHFDGIREIIEARYEIFS
jgi:hypothetical protein